MAIQGTIGNIKLGDQSYAIASTATAICSTSASTQVKRANIVGTSSAGFDILNGIIVNVLFVNGNTANNPKLLVNYAGPIDGYAIKNYDGSPVEWSAGSILTLIYLSNLVDEAITSSGWYIVSNNSNSNSETYEILWEQNPPQLPAYSDILSALNAGKFVYVKDTYHTYGSQEDNYSTLYGYYSYLNQWETQSQKTIDVLVFSGRGPDNTWHFWEFNNADSDTLTEEHLSSYRYRTDAFAYDSHSHGNITSGGDITTNATITSGDRLIINDESDNKLANSSITFGSNSLQYLANNGTWQNIPKNADDINYTLYDQRDWPEYDPQDVEAALDILAARKTGTADVQVDSTSILSSGVANIITSSSHPYNASSNVLATMGDISAINVGATDVQVNGASILNSGVANLITNTAYNASSNKLATMSDISAATSGVGDVKINGVSILSGGEANIITHGAYNASSNKIATMSDLPGNFGADEIMYSTSLQEWSSIRPAGDPTDVEQALEALAQYTVDHDGTVTSITAGTGLTGGTITSFGTIALGTSGVTAGTYQGLTIDTYGRVTSASNQNYLTSETDPTVPAWAKASTKPTYTASEVGALSSTVPVNIGDSLYLRGTGLWRSTETANADRIITTVNSGKDLMINADSTKTDANTGIIYLGYTNTTAVNIGGSSSDVALKYNGSAVFSNSYTSPSVYSSRCTITNGGYMQIGKWVIVNLYITIDATLNANTNSLLVYNLPEPEFSMSLSASTTAPGTVKGLNSFIRKHATSGVTKGEVCICSTSGLASGNVVLISGIYTVS